MHFILEETFWKQVRLPRFVSWLVWVLLQKRSSVGGSKKRVNQNRESDTRIQQAKLQGCCHLCPFLYGQWEMEFGSCNCSFHTSLAVVETTTFYLSMCSLVLGTLLILFQVWDHVAYRSQCCCCCLRLCSAYWHLFPELHLQGGFTLLTSSCQVTGKGNK